MTDKKITDIDIQIFKEIWQNEQTIWKIIETKLAEKV